MKVNFRWPRWPVSARRFSPGKASCRPIQRCGEPGSSTYRSTSSILFDQLGNWVNLLDPADPVSKSGQYTGSNRQPLGNWRLRIKQSQRRNKVD